MSIDFSVRQSNILILLTRYWNIAYKPNEHNLAQHAINHGYSIFFYDRLGVGDSTRYASSHDFNTMLPYLLYLCQPFREHALTTILFPIE